MAANDLGGMGSNSVVSDESRIWPLVALVWAATKVSDVGWGQPLVSDKSEQQK